MDSSVHPRIRQCAVLEADAVCDHLHVPSDGLSTEQAEKSRAQFGSNAVSSGTADTVGFRLRRAFINPFTVILFLLAVISGDRCRSGFQFQPQRYDGHHYMLHAAAQRHGALCAGTARKAHLRPPLRPDDTPRSRSVGMVSGLVCPRPLWLWAILYACPPVTVSRPIYV